MPLAEILLLVAIWAVLMFLVGAFVWSADRLRRLQRQDRGQAPEQDPIEPAA